MIIKGNARAGAKSLAAHVLRTDTNERVEVAEVRGTVAEDVLGAVREMEAVAACTRTGKPLYHASINTRADERLTDEQRFRAIDRLEEALNLTGQPRVVVIHEKEGREHCHVIWSRTDLEHSRAIRMDHNFRTHELVARALEREFGHERVQGAHAERDDRERPKRTPGHDEWQQAARSGWKPGDAKAFVTDIWNHTDNGRSFEALLAEKGWLLARGDRRDFVVVDPQGGVHSLSRRVDGYTAAEVRDRMRDLEDVPMPGVEEARAVQRKIAELEEALGEGKPKKPSSPPIETPASWTDDAGMVQQQRSALNWINAAHRQEERARGTPEPPPSPSGPGPGSQHEDNKITFYKDLHPDKGHDRDR